MGRTGRVVLNVVTVASLLACAATGGAWAWSYGGLMEVRGASGGVLRRVVVAEGDVAVSWFAGWPCAEAVRGRYAARPAPIRGSPLDPAPHVSTGNQSPAAFWTREDKWGARWEWGLFRTVYRTDGKPPPLGAWRYLYMESVQNSLTLPLRFRAVTFPMSYIFALFAALPLVRGARWARRAWVGAPTDDDGRRPACVRCGYDLTGNVSGVCPECGTAVPRVATE